jgi:hypothetical protein
MNTAEEPPHPDPLPGGARERIGLPNLAPRGEVGRRPGEGDGGSDRRS